MIDHDAAVELGTATSAASATSSPAGSTRCRASRPSTRSGASTAAMRSSRRRSTAISTSSSACSAKRPRMTATRWWPRPISPRRPARSTRCWPTRAGASNKGPPSPGYERAALGAPFVLATPRVIPAQRGSAAQRTISISTCDRAWSSACAAPAPSTAPAGTRAEKSCARWMWPVRSRDQLGGDLDHRAAAGRIDVEGADVGVELVVRDDALARPRDRGDAAAVLEGLDQADLHQLGHAVGPLRAAEEGERAGGILDDDAVGIERLDRRRLVARRLPRASRRAGRNRAAPRGRRSSASRRRRSRPARAQPARPERHGRRCGAGGQARRTSACG